MNYSNNTKCWWGCKETIIHTLLVGIQNGIATWKRVWQFLTKLNVQLTYDTVTVLLGTYPGKMKVYVHTKTCAWKFIAAVFIIAKNWKQPKSPSPDEWLIKLRYTQTIEYYSAKKNGINYWYT